MDDPLGAFVPHGHIEIAGARTGLLAGATFAVKDIFDVAGTVTGRGNPDWLATHPPATRHAPAVQALLAAGARLVGKVITEELAFSAVGINPHYGAPQNAAAPGRIAGGSSSGSASAVGGGLVDLALGSDTGGSVRLPASYNGILGMRPSHGRISLEGIMPLAPSFDTVGWFARDPKLFATAGRVLLDDWAPGRRPRRLLLARDAFERAGSAVHDALRPAIGAVEERLGAALPVTVSEDGLNAWHDVFRTLQGAEAWAEHGAWIEGTRPNIGPFLVERLRLASRLTTAEVAAARVQQAVIRRRLDELLAGDALLLLPSAPGPATLLDAPMEEHERVRQRAIGITCIASLGGLPQVSLPLGRLAEGPIGLSLIAARGQDALLLDLVESGIGALRQPAR
ncbi:MAG TPA: amidase [Geminicoccaceae bacterium]|nr:amidase [Geminicoccaceae bacterium]